MNQRVAKRSSHEKSNVAALLFLKGDFFRFCFFEFDFFNVACFKFAWFKKSHAKKFSNTLR